ncbi:MAG: hypothetical protein ACK553_15890 [Planctomycetota bacterium]|jgi:hypothetical protein
MGSFVGLLKIVVIWMLGWIGMGMVPAFGQSADSIQVVMISLDPDLTAELTAQVPSVRVVVLHHHPGEPYEALNARALALRNASYLLFDASCESTCLAMFRERLEMQGVIPVNLRQIAPYRREQFRHGRSKKYEPIVSLLSSMPEIPK